MAKAEKSNKNYKKSDKKNTKVKVQPAEDKQDTHDKAKSMILKHPWVTQNARSDFNHENGKTIIEEVVPRGDANQEEAIMPRTEGDLSDLDLKEIAVYATSIVDEKLADYDKTVAYEDALRKAIWSKDGGKYSGRVSSVTFALLLDQMYGLTKKAAAVSAPVKKDESPTGEEKSVKVEDEATTGEEKKKPKSLDEKIRSKHQDIVKKQKEQRSSEACMDKKVGEVITAGHPHGTDDVEWKVVKEAVINAAEDIFKKVDMKKIEGIMKNLYKHKPNDTENAIQIGIDMLRSKKASESSTNLSDTADKTDLKQAIEAMEEKLASLKASIVSEEEATNPITARLDKVASVLEAQEDEELKKLAFQVDLISDVIDGKKEASVLEGDADEAFMKEHFKAGLREGDKDEKAYMKEYNTDTTKEVVKVASEEKIVSKVPYQKVNK